jgi:hypothetical protein
VAEGGAAVRGIKLSILLILIFASLAVSFTFSYIAVVSQNPKPVSNPLYGPGDSAAH